MASTPLTVRMRQVSASTSRQWLSAWNRLLSCAASRARSAASNRASHWLAIASMRLTMPKSTDRGQPADCSVMRCAPCWSRMLRAVLLGIVALLAACGGGSSAPECPATGCPAPAQTRYFAYVANDINMSGTVSGFAIDAGNGVLTAVSGSPLGTAANPEAVAADSLGRFVYVANFGAASISGYIVNANTGVLAPIAGSPFATSAPLPRALAMTPSSAFLYVAHGATANSVSAYMVNANSGALSPVGAPVAAATDPSALAIDPSGSFAYVTNAGDEYRLGLFDQRHDGCAGGHRLGGRHRHVAASDRHRAQRPVRLRARTRSRTTSRFSRSTP